MAGSGSSLFFEAPVSRLHLVHVDPNGTARLKLRPRYERQANQRVIQVDEAPIYDAPPTLDTLFAEAARNHELEVAFHAQHVAVRDKRLDAQQSWRDQVAASFLGDPSQRAVMHPSPTVRRCFINTARGRMEFHAKRDSGLSRAVPREAHRRFEADIRARRQRAEDNVVAFHAAHSEKWRVIRAWMGEHGSDDQRHRLLAGVLPEQEAVEAMSAHTFRALAHLAPYTHDGAARLQAHVRQVAPYEAATISPGALLVATRHLSDATSAQWAVLNEVQAAVPDAQVFLRERMLSWRDERKAPKLRIVTVLAFTKIGPITVRREFCVPEMCSSVPCDEGDAE